MALFYCFRKLLLRGLGSLDSLDQHGSDLEQVAADAVVSDLKDGSGVILVDGDDALGILHTSLVLDSTGDTQSNVHLGVNGLAGLTNLMVGRQPAGVDGGTGAANNAAQNLSQLLSQLDAALNVLADAAANGQIGRASCRERV